MNTPVVSPTPTPSEVSSEQLLAALQAAVSAALERKRRLGHYAVVWQNGRAVAVGEDGPGDEAGLQASEPAVPAFGQAKPLA